jgi:lipopolysaccharide export system ATP-binding protein
LSEGQAPAPAQSKSVTVLHARQLTKRYRKRLAVDHVDFSVARGEVVGLLGPNGAGKTTSFNMVAGLTRADSGQVTLGSTDLSQMPLYQRARAGLGYLPQEASIFRKLTVRENFIAILELNRALSRQDIRQQAEATLHEFGLSHVADGLGETLSGGERRRAEIARSLLHDPQFILFDEPFAGVDPLNVIELQKELVRLKARGLGVLITDHNVRETLRICDRAYILVDGKILEEGTPQKLLESPVARRFYLGESFSL